MQAMSPLLVADPAQEASPILNGARLEALKRTNLLDSESEPAFDRLTELACIFLDTPVALVSLVDKDRQFFKSARGLPEPWASRRETPLSHSFCKHVVISKRPFVIGDAPQDPVVCDNLAIPELGVVAYLGIPLFSADGHAIGSFCGIDSKSREWTRRQIRVMVLLADSVMSEISLRSHLQIVEQQKRNIERQTDELRRVNHELEQFASVAAHDLQEPVRSLVSFTSLLREDLGDDLPAEAETDLRYISEAALRMQRLIRDLLTLSRTGRVDFESTKVQLGACLDEALDALRSGVAESGASIERCELPAVTGSRTLLTQLYQNLLSNALKFSTATPRVTLTAESGDAFWTLGVRDEGIGIKPEYTERIFEPFKRLHGVSQYEGSGIGLAVCRKAVERHGGKIWVESVPGRGSHFRFTLPIEV